MTQYRDIYEARNAYLRGSLTKDRCYSKYEFLSAVSFLHRLEALRRDARCLIAQMCVMLQRTVTFTIPRAGAFLPPPKNAANRRSRAGGSYPIRSLTIAERAGRSVYDKCVNLARFESASRSLARLKITQKVRDSTSRLRLPIDFE